MISIIVPIYNMEKYLRKCIDSILEQTYAELEIILVDDGSTDGCYEICEAYRKKDARIVVLHQVNGGLVSARKAGIRIARGTYIGFVDSDDWVESDMFENLYREAIEKNADIVVDGIIEDTEGFCRQRTNALQVGTYSSDEAKNHIYRNMISCGEYFKIGILPYLCNKLIRRELAVRHMMTIDEKIRVGEDAAAVYPILMLSDRIIITNKFHYHYCLRKSSMTWNRCREEEEHAELVCFHNFLKNTFSQYGKWSVMKEQTEKYSINNVLVRTFSRYAAQFEGTKLFPFKGIMDGDSILIYGAGAFGRAVYKYASQQSWLNVIDWVDGDAEFYQKLGMPVHSTEHLFHQRNLKVVISVLSKKAAGEIKGKLLRKGFLEEQLIWLTIEDNDRDRIISSLEA